MINKILKLANSFYSFAAPLDELIQTESMRDVPDVQAYKEHYSASGNLYRIIYVD